MTHKVLLVVWTTLFIIFPTLFLTKYMAKIYLLH